MTTKYTPGPWTVEADMRIEECRATRAELSYLAGWNITSQSEEIVGCEGIIPGPTSEANARLIAAAPELVEALRGLLKGTYGDGYVLPAGAIATNRARALLARIEGE
jgi:hypothetical protein